MAEKRCPITCWCHNKRPYMHSVPEGCGDHGCDLPGRLGVFGDNWCRRGTRCIGYDHTTKTPGPVPPYAPICDDCLRPISRDVGMLAYDHSDLAALQIPALSHPWDSQPIGKAGPPMPIKGEPEALQAEIVHTLTTWEAILRDVDRLATIDLSGPIPDWATTVSWPVPAPRVSSYQLADRALAVIRPRIDRLRALPRQEVFPTGCEDEPTDLYGWQALLHLAYLHTRARSMLGRTRRTFWVPGECWQDMCRLRHDVAVKAGKNRREWLWRSEPEEYLDPVFIFCDYCDEYRTWDEYDAYVRMMVWPKLHPMEVDA